jgi:hypothetical protein
MIGLFYFVLFLAANKVSGGRRANAAIANTATADHG